MRGKSCVQCGSQSDEKSTFSSKALVSQEGGAMGSISLGVGYLSETPETQGLITFFPH